MSHRPSTQAPTEQSALVLQLGACSQVPSVQSRPSLHSLELLQVPPQSTLPRAAPFFPQPGKFGGQSSFAEQRAGGFASAKCGASSAVVSTNRMRTGSDLVPQLPTSSPLASLARTNKWSSPAMPVL